MAKIYVSREMTNTLKWDPNAHTEAKLVQFSSFNKQNINKDLQFRQEKFNFNSR